MYKNSLYILGVNPLSDLDITDLLPLWETYDVMDHKYFLFTLLYSVIPNFKNELLANNKNNIFLNAVPLFN